MNPRPWFLGAILLSGWTAGCEPSADIATVPDDYLAFDADGIVFGMEQWITEDGILQGYVRADTAIQWQDSAAVHLRGQVDLKVLETDGSERAHVTADRGVMDMRTNRMIARGNVVLVIPGDSRRLETEELHYDPQGDRIWSDSAFVHRHRGQITRGRAFTSDLEFRNFTILGRGGGGAR